MGAVSASIGIVTVNYNSAAFIGEFLDHLERTRGNSSRTRNARLAAIHSFAHYVAGPGSVPN